MSCPDARDLIERGASTARTLAALGYVYTDPVYCRDGRVGRSQNGRKAIVRDGRIVAVLSAHECNEWIGRLVRKLGAMKEGRERS